MPKAGSGASIRQVIYSAFISYSSSDVAHARWLHRALETYKLPKGSRTDHLALRPDGRRLKPVFRDRDELSASPDLGASIRKALSECEALVVLCSPRSARSKWVDAEVREFQRLGRASRIFCLLVEAGEDGAIAECFPPSLLDKDGTEPLAADLRVEMDGRTGAKLKVIAGIVQLDFDRLRQREQSRRNRQLVLIASASVTGLVITSGLALIAYFASVEAYHQRDIARERTATAEQTVAFVKGMFEVADPSEARGSAITAREILDGARERYRIALRNEPVVQSEIALTLSEVYGSLGLDDQSAALANAIPAAALGNSDVGTRRNLVRGELRLRDLDFAPAAAAFRAAIDVQRSAERNNPALVARAFNGLGQALTGLEQYEEAEAALRRALTINTARGDAGRRDVARDLEGLGLNDFYAGDLEPAKERITRANRIRLSLEGEKSPSVSDNVGTLASIAYFEGRGADAERLFRSRLAIDEQVLGDDHPDVALTLNNIARLLMERQAYAEADALLARAIDITRRKRGGAYAELAFMLGTMGIVQRARGRPDEAEAVLRESIDVARQQAHRMQGPNMVELASLLCARGQFAEAAALLDQAGPVMSEFYAPEEWQHAWLRLARAQCLLDEGRRPEARNAVGEGFATIAERWPVGSYFRSRADRLRNALGVRSPS